MKAFEKNQEQLNVWKTYANMAAMAQGLPSGIPAIDPRANDPEWLPYYEKLADLLDGYASGFPRPEDLKQGEFAGTVPKGSDIQYLQTYYLPEHAKLAIHVPIHGFESAAQIAAKAGISEEDALKTLMEMAERVCIFHKERDGVHLFRHLGPFPGQVAMSVGRLSLEFWGGIEPYLANYMRPVMFDQEAPAWRYVPLTDAEVAEEDRKVIEDYEVAERILMNARAVSVTSCICRAPLPQGCKQTKPPYDVCLQVNDFADFYVKDLKISRYMTKEEIKLHIQRCKDEHLAILLSGSKDAEIMCSCCNDGCCGPTNYFIKYGMAGPHTGRVTHFRVDMDKDKCMKCGTCVERCYTNHGFLREGNEIVHHQENCTGCGVCVRECPADALILRLKDEKDRFDWPTSAMDLYETQGKDTYGIKVTYLKRGRGKK